MQYQVTKGLVTAVNEWMKDRGLSSRAAAKVIGCSHQTIANLKNGKTEFIHDKTLESLEHYVNKYRHPEDLQEFITEGFDKVGGYNPDLLNWSTDSIYEIKKYKERKGLSYEDMSIKYKFPLIKLVKYLETEHTGDFFTVDPEDVSPFMAMALKISSENFTENKEGYK